MWFRGREARRRSIAKAISWRLTGSFDTFVIGWIVTGRTAVAGTIAATELLTKIVLYYVHERAWAFIPWGHRGGETSEKPYPNTSSELSTPTSTPSLP